MVSYQSQVYESKANNGSFLNSIGISVDLLAIDDLVLMPAGVIVGLYQLDIYFGFVIDSHLGGLSAAGAKYFHYAYLR